MRTWLHRNLPATRYSDFNALWGGTACSSISLWTLLLGNAYIVFHLSDSSAWVGVATFASMSPFLLAPAGGIVADRFERRLLVRVTRVGAFATTATLYLLAVTDVLTVWLVIAVALVQGVIRAVEIPSDQALLANVVPADALANAVTLNTMTQQGSRAAGPVLSAPLLATVGVEGVYLVAAIFALLAFTSVRRVKTSTRGGVTSAGQVFGNLAEALRYVRHTPPVLAVFLLVVAHCSLTMSFDAMLPGFADHHLHEPRDALTLMVFGVGIGALVGTLWLSLSGSRHRGRLFLLTGLASGISPVVMGLSMNIPSALASAILMGASQAMFMALSAVLLQEVVPDAIRGRVMSFYLMSAGGIMAFANLGFGALADATSIPLLFAVPGMVFAAIVLATLVAGTSLRRVYRSGFVPV